jgi:hypothetical protein
MFTTLTLADMVSIVVGSPPTSSVKHFLDGGWTRTDHLIANMQEGQLGLKEMSEPYSRPTAPAPQDDVDGALLRTFQADTMEWLEFDRLQELRATAPVGKAHVRTI